MKLKIAGGCGEHGRNCFLVYTGKTAFLVDCGIMAGETDNPYPDLTPDEIRQIRYVFLTHSHADHTGALPWLMKNGFEGIVVASEETFSQLNFSLERRITLEKLCQNQYGEIDHLEVFYGRSGHCAGSVWYRFTDQGESMLFSGDYTEKTTVYAFDTIRNQKADLAVLDCAYGVDSMKYQDYCIQLMSETERLKEQYGVILFPVPRFGRGLELLRLFTEKHPEWNYYADARIMKQISQINQKGYWYHIVQNDLKSVTRIPSHTIKTGLVFVSDPQLRHDKSRKLADCILHSGGTAMMTGTVEKGSLSELLVLDGKMYFNRYPVHSDWNQYTILQEQNTFTKTIPFHCDTLQ